MARGFESKMVEFNQEEAARKKNSVHSTLKIMKRISHAPPVWEP